MGLVLELQVLAVKFQLEGAGSDLLGESGLVEAVQVRSQGRQVHVWVRLRDGGLIELDARLADEERDGLLVLVLLVVDLADDHSTCLLEGVGQEWHLDCFLDLV